MADYNFKAFRILVVDDSASIRQLIHSTLDIIGVGHVEVAAHGGEAVEIIKKSAKPLIRPHIRQWTFGKQAELSSFLVNGYAHACLFRAISVTSALLSADTGGKEWPI